MGRKHLVVIVLAAVVTVAAACTPTMGGSTTTTTPGSWLVAGCLDGAGTDGATAPDLLFNGTPNQRGNAQFFASLANGTLSFSGNGTCQGTPFGALTIVRAGTAGQAASACAALEAGETATSFTGSAWTAPADAWACSETILL